MIGAADSVPRNKRLSQDRTWIVAALLAFVAPLIFAAFAQQTWEDYYITFRSSRNLVDGHGLVYQVGERVHTFTSPLGVLLPALGYAVTGNDQATLWLFRITSALFVAGAAALIVAHAFEHEWRRGYYWLVLCLAIFEAKTLAFSANGMETGLLIFFAALTWREVTRPRGPEWVLLALGFAGLMWTRPDGCIVAAAMTLAYWLFGPRCMSRDERHWWRKWTAALLIGGLLYAPWLIWSWHYYGSPIPQTVVAKSALSPEGWSASRLIAAPLRCLVSDTALDGLFAPIYFQSGGWPRDLINVGRLLARAAAFVWVIPSLPRSTRAASLATLLGGVYLHQIMPYPWYYAPWTLLAAIALAGTVSFLASRASDRTSSIGRITAGTVAVSMLLISVAQAHSARIQQQLIEDGCRKEIGLWLRNHASVTDTVFLEPIGYIGYFSGMKILDFPGIVSPAVSGLVRGRARSYPHVIGALEPTWIVLRPSEVADQHLDETDALANYGIAAHWNVRPKLDAQPFVAGRGWLQFDCEFLVLRRRSTELLGPGSIK
jgi:hypothetical protein